MKKLIYIVLSITVIVLLCAFRNHEQVSDVSEIQIKIGDTIGKVRLNPGTTTDAFLEMLPFTINMQDLHGREYWFAHSLPFDSADVIHSYEPGQLTYWCGGWVTAYYDRDDDSVIEDGSVVIGEMDEALMEAFRSLNRQSTQAEFTYITSEEKMTYKSWNEVPQTSYREEVITVDYNGQTIWGVAYIPENGQAVHPLVICSHGLGGSYMSCMEYVELLASHGIAAYCFDFRGGGGSRSDGSTTEMSLITEATDLQTIINAAKTWSFVDPEKIILLGESQGGAASAIAAARISEDVSGLILCYPALLVHDAVHQQFSSLDQVPESYYFNWIMAGRPYAADVWDYDVYAEIGNYTKPVLLMHGDRDGIVPIAYAERAAEVYPDVEYYVISGGGHGFYGTALDDAAGHILDYLQKIDLL